MGRFFPFSNHHYLSHNRLIPKHLQYDQQIKPNALG